MMRCTKPKKQARTAWLWQSNQEKACNPFPLAVTAICTRPVFSYRDIFDCKFDQGNPLSQPVISLCIPTYNRDKYLRCLLGGLLSDIEKLTHPYEIVIADNGSTDNTEGAVAEYAGRLNIRYIKRDRNYGSHNNLIFVQNEAQGQLQFYVADDDALLLSEVSAIADLMLADPSIGVVYAPWHLHDLVSNQSRGQFYQQEEDRLIEKGDHHGLLAFLLQHSVFPEIYIYRRDVWQAVQPRVNEQAFYAFVHAAEFLAQTRLLFHKRPYYVSITNYFPGEYREQVGIIEVEGAWDRYRGGLGYILSRIPHDTLGKEKLNQFAAQIQHVIAQRLSVALRVRLAKQRDMIENYYLSSRLHALGYAQLAAVPHKNIALSAALQFLCTDVLLMQDAKQLICVGDYPEMIRQHISSNAQLPVRFEPSFEPDTYAEALVLVPGSVLGADINAAWQLSRRVRIIGFEDLLTKFS